VKIVVPNLRVKKRLKKLIQKYLRDYLLRSVQVGVPINKRRLFKLNRNKTEIKHR
jgi:hypothetical protein